MSLGARTVPEFLYNHFRQLLRLTDKKLSDEWKDETNRYYIVIRNGDSRRHPRQKRDGFAGIYFYAIVGCLRNPQTNEQVRCNEIAENIKQTALFKNSYAMVYLRLQST